jgi:hypothetical protein
MRIAEEEERTARQERSVQLARGRDAGERTYNVHVHVEKERRRWETQEPARMWKNGGEGGFRR